MKAPTNTQTKKGKKKTGTVEDDDEIQLDYETVQRFGKLSIPPPVEVDDCEKTQQLITDLRDALRAHGKLEQTEAKARFLHNDELTNTDEYKEMRKEYDALPAELKKHVEHIRHEVRFGRNHAEDGIEIDQDYTEDDVANIEKRRNDRRSAMTELRPETGNRGGRGRGGRGGQGERGGKPRGQRGN